MSLYDFVDVIFALVVVVSGVALFSYVVCGILLASKMKIYAPTVMKKLGNPYGVATILMRNTPLYDDFLKIGAHKKSGSQEIEKLGKIIVLSKSVFHYTALLSALCLVSLLVLKNN
ncbi:hypothetical protein [Marinobacter bohaiensis]|uniref:hypothetical protein n=1 Tax=Marinobacter bohaiensis TaxID=2201898 RepID=UPI0013A695CF|nr:hypothetical protein [Marinobacter bohaiensis]